MGDWGSHATGTYLTADEVEQAGGMTGKVIRLAVEPLKFGTKDVAYLSVGGRERGLVINRKSMLVLTEWLHGRGEQALVGATLNLAAVEVKGSAGMVLSIQVTSVRKTAQGKVA